MNILRHITVFAAALILAVPVSAHHSDAGMDMESTITFEGTVKEYAWRNPHVYVIVETEQSGEPVDWELQTMLDFTSMYMMEIDLSRQEEVIIIRDEVNAGRWLTDWSANPGKIRRV